MPASSKVAAIFPGQGSQELGMGRDLAEIENEYMDNWRLAEKASGLELREIYWEAGAGDMADTRALQPAMTAACINVWLHLGKAVNPGCVAGHSLGEYAALVAAGVLSVKEALEITALRGRLMDEAAGDNQGMSAILKLDLDTVTDIVAQAREATGAELLIANFNSPGQLVVSGQTEALEATAALAKQAKGRAIPLPVSGAFHSPLVAEAAKELAGQLKKLHWNAPRIPILFNVTGQTESDPEAIKDIMCRQMISGVRWMDILANQWDAGVRTWFELGPKGVLTKLLKANFKDHDEEWTGTSLPGLDEAQKAGLA